MYQVDFLANGFSHNGRALCGDPFGWVLGDYWGTLTQSVTILLGGEMVYLVDSLFRLQTVLLFSFLSQLN